MDKLLPSRYYLIKRDSSKLNKTIKSIKEFVRKRNNKMRRRGGLDNYWWAIISTKNPPTAPIVVVIRQLSKPILLIEF